MKASPLGPLIVLLTSVWLGGPVIAEYPFDPMIDQGPVGPQGDYGSPYGGGPLIDESYGPDPFRYDDPYPVADQLFAHDTPIWPGWVSATYQPGTDRSLGIGEWFQPLYQDGHTLWYFDFRGQGDSDSASEFNLGTGVRILSEPGWIFGAYAFWDHLQSSNGNNFNQGMIGIEAMDVFWDARLNVYFPESSAKRVGVPRARISNGNVVVQSGLERAYWGMDFEVGNLLWAWGPNASHELRGFAGVYHFDHSANATQSITGPRGRLEWRWYDLFGPGSRLTCGLTVQADRVRDGQLFGFIRLRLPLDPWSHSRRPLTPLQRRMLDRVVRDVDIVAATSTQTEPAVNPHTGRPITGVHEVDGNTPYVGDLLHDSQPDEIYVFNGDAGDIVLPQSFALKPGQTVLGGGSSLMVRGASSGLRTTWETGGSRPTVEFDGNATIVWREPPPGTAAGFNTMMKPDPVGFDMADRTSLSGVDIIGGIASVRAANVSDVAIHDVNIRKFQNAGIEVTGSRDVSIHDVTIADIGPIQGPLNFVPQMPIEFLADAGAAPNDRTDVAALSLPWEPPNDDDKPSQTGLFVYDSHDVRVANTDIRDVAEGMRFVKSGNVLVEQSSVENATLDGIRLIETTGVTLSDIDLENVATQQLHVYWPTESNYVTRSVSGISLRDTDQTTIRDSRLKSIVGYGLFAENASSTWIDSVTMTNVDNGLYASQGNDLEVSNTNISLSAQRTRVENGLPRLFVFYDNASVVRLYDVTGDVTIRDSQLESGRGTSIVDIRNSTGATNLQITGSRIGWVSPSNVTTAPQTIAFISDVAESTVMSISSTGTHELVAHIEGNDFVGGKSINFSNRSDAANQLTFKQNSTDGTFYAQAQDDSRLNLSVTDNVFSGDRMGGVFATRNKYLNLIYTGNTSTPGAEVMQFTNTLGSLDAVINGNNHTPAMDGEIRELAIGITSGGQTTN